MGRRFTAIGFFALSSVATLVACSDSGAENAPSDHPPFLAIDRSTSFYLAISKKALDEKWFLDSFLNSAGVSNGLLHMDTHVVTFREHDGKVTVLDASDNHASDSLIGDYPIVPANVAAQDGYIVVDPAKGKGHLGASDVMDSLAGGQLNVSSVHSENFRRLDDGVTFEEAFNGSSASPASGTLGLSFRRYAESPSFQRVAAPSSKFYILERNQAERNTNGTPNWAAHWPIHPGMKPIRWVLSSEFSKAQKDFPQYDIIAAAKRGITNWNQAFGFEALTVEVAKDGTSVDDHDTNLVSLDLLRR